jgi:uncharacterized protein (DUF362 family)
MDAAGAAGLLPRGGPIILKPNLTNDSPPPVTTPVECVEAVWRYCAAHSGAEIAIGEGCGSGRTIETFRANGYEKFARRKKLRLIDFNEEPDARLERPDALQLEELWLPQVALAGMHLAGTPRKLGRILAGSDPVAVDAAASRLLDHDPRKIEYLRLADGRLGSMG